jgi:hypothetical protein
MNDHITHDMKIDFNEVFQGAAADIHALIARENSSQLLANSLNSLVPLKVEVMKRGLVAILEDRLANRAEKIISTLTPQLRTRYYDAGVESKLASNFCFDEWTHWIPFLAEGVKNTGFALTAVFGLAALLATLKELGISTLRIPPHSGDYPSSPIILYTSLAILSGIVASHSEKMPTLMNKERERARDHAAAYFHKNQILFFDFVRQTESELDRYIGKLQDEDSKTV